MFVPFQRQPISWNALEPFDPMRALLLLALVPVLMWLTQSALLWCAGRPLRLRISGADLPERFKRINRVATKAVFVVVLAVYPLLRGESPMDFYPPFLPLGTPMLSMIYGSAAAVLYLTLLYLAWALTDNVRFQIRHEPGRLWRRLAGVPFTAVFVALAEELLFRAVLLHDLLESMDVWLALPIGIFVFAAAHYVRGVKRYWTFPGHLALGALFCVAFYCTRTLWLPIGLHAGGVLVLMGARPMIRYTGPAWLVGASIFPYAGLVGIVALGLLTLNIWLQFDRSI